MFMTADRQATDSLGQSSLPGTAGQKGGRIRKTKKKKKKKEVSPVFDKLGADRLQIADVQASTVKNPGVRAAPSLGGYVIHFRPLHARR